MSGCLSFSKQPYLLDNARFELFELGVDYFEGIVLGVVPVVIVYKAVDECVFELR